MDIKFNVKGLSIIRGQIKVDDIDVGVSATEGETLNSNECILEIIENPAVQRLINKFTEEVNFKPVAHKSAQQPKTADTMAELDKRLNSVFSQVKRELDSDREAREAERQLIEKLMNRASKLSERNSKF